MKRSILSQPTEEQLESRRKLREFVEAASQTLRGLTSTVRSAWYGRPNEELQGYIEQGRALDEIKDSRFYALLMFTLDRQIQWLQDQLEVCQEKDMRELRACLKSFRFIRSYILTTERAADIASGVLAGRGGAIARDAAQFVKNARVEG